MDWIDKHIEWLVTGILSAAGAVVVFFARLAWRDRKGVMDRLKSMEAARVEDSGKLTTLATDIKRMESIHAEERREIAERLETHHREVREDTEKIHTRVTDVVRGVSRIEGVLQGMSRNQQGG